MQEFIYYNKNGLDFPLSEKIQVTTTRSKAEVYADYLREPLIINYQEHFSNLSRNFS